MFGYSTYESDRRFRSNWPVISKALYGETWARFLFNSGSQFEDDWQSIELITPVSVLEYKRGAVYGLMESCVQVVYFVLRRSWTSYVSDSCIAPGKEKQIHP